MYRTIIFDFGNVVAHFDHSLVSKCLAPFSPLDVNQLHSLLFGGPLESDYESGRLTTEGFLARARLEGRLGCSNSDLIAAYSDIFWPNPPIESLLAALKPRYRLVLASNTTELHWGQIRRQFGKMVSYFDARALSYEIGFRKPAKEFFEHAGSLALCEPEECLFIDDLAMNVQSARELGWDAIAYRGFSDLCAALSARGVILTAPAENRPPSDQVLPPALILESVSFSRQRGRLTQAAARDAERRCPLDVLRAADPEVWQAIDGERRRQQEGLEMIASENYTSPAVLAAQGSVLTNKYAEGYPGRRYYGGCEFVDAVERLAIERVLRLFGAEKANVQPHSGAQANMAVYFACLQPGDTMLAMDLAHGGHLTHGMRLNFSGKLYHVVSYGVRKDTEQIDYDQVAALVIEHRPKLVVAGASAYPRAIDFARFGQICAEQGTLLMVDMAHVAGLVAAGLHPDPVPHAHFVTSTAHKTLRGPRSGFVLCKSDWAAKINQTVFPGIQGGPLMHVIAAKAVAFGEALRPEFRAHMAQVVANARVLAEELARLGFRLVSGGTDNHLLLVDVASRGLTGKVAEQALDAAGITVNKNMIPFDTRPPLDPSGIRIGTPALTTRGMREDEMRRIAGWVGAVLADPSDTAAQRRVREEVRALCRQFRAPAEAVGA